MSLRLHPLAGLAALLCASLPAFAQGGPLFYTNDPGTPGHLNWEINLGYMPLLYSKHYYSILYSPSTVSHNGGLVSVTIDTVFTDSFPIRFFVIQLNCRTRQYMWAMYDTSTTPAKLLPTSEWIDIQPSTAGAAMEPIFCK